MMLRSAPLAKPAKVPRMIRCWRMMQELRVITFDDAVGIVDAELALIDKQAIGWRLAFEERCGAFDAPDPTDQRTGEESDDAEVSDEKCHVMFSPWPARQCGDGEIRAQDDQPEVEPRRSINVGARNLGIEG